MPDDQKTPTGGETKPDEQVTMSRAEVEKLRSDSARIAKYDNMAKEADMANAEELFETYEEFAAKQLETAGKPADPPKPEPNGGKPPEPKPEVKPQGPDPVAVRSLIESQLTNYRFDQAQMPETDRDNIPLNELKQTIEKDSALVAHVAKTKTGGDLARAAVIVYSLNNKEKKAQTDAEAAARARQEAAASAQLGVGGRPATPGAKTPEQMRAEENKTRADRIAPDTPYVFPG
jgi:hypothetical protein